MARIQDIVIDCAHAASLARFWAAALDGFEVAPYTEEELERLRAKGIASPEDDPTVLVEASGTTPRVWLQQVPEPRVGKVRLHLDLMPAAGVDADDEARRLVALGATIADEQRNDGLIVMHDPEGNVFCVLREL
jgi:Glyoxalase-like domain